MIRRYEPRVRGKPPPDVAEAPEGATTDGTHADLVDLDPNRTVAHCFGRHAWWICVTRSHTTGRCPRCCWCFTREVCDHPAFAEVVSAA